MKCLSTVAQKDLQEVATSLGFQIQPKDEADYLSLLRSAVSAVETVNKMPAYRDPRLSWDDKDETRSYMEPKEAENPLNAWSHRVRQTSRPIPATR